MRNHQPTNLSPAELQDVIRKVHALRKVSKVMGFNTNHEIVNILEQLSADDLISIGEELKLKSREMSRLKQQSERTNQNTTEQSAQERGALNAGFAGAIRE